MKYLFISVVLFAILQYKFSDRPRGNPNSNEDSSFDFSSVSTIGFIPFYGKESAEIRKIDAVAEKQIYGYLKNELELKGYKVSYINRNNLKSVKRTGGIEFMDMDTYPDVVLFVNFWQHQVKGQAFFPMRHYEAAKGKNGKDSGFYYNDTLYNNKIYLYINCILLTGQPGYSKKIWSGEISKTSNIPDLNEKAEMMIQNLFLEEFKHQSNTSLLE